MGLRERKTARTREQIVDVALDLFIEQGYDQTTMEQIAERAEVGTSTLYRYFPSKDLLILDRIIQSIRFGPALRERPSDEPLGISLGAVIQAALRDLEVDDERLTAIRRMIDDAPVPRARLWDLLAQARTELEVAIAERLALPPTDLAVALNARIALSVFEIAGETWWSGDHSKSRSAVVNEVLRSLARVDIVLPAPTPHR